MRSELGRGCDLTAPALGAVALVAAVTAAGAYWSPAVRHQLALSFEHQPSSYVELAFPGRDAELACTPTKRVVSVRFTMTGHGTGPRDVDYTVELTGLAPVTAAAHLVPGRTQTIVARRPAPAGPYGVSVTAGAARLALHCGEGR